MIGISSEFKIKRNTLFAIGFLLLFIQFWTRDIFEISEYIFYVPAFLLMILSTNVKNISKKEMITIIIMNIIGIISFIFSKSMTILKITLILSTAKNRNMDKVIKYSFWAGIVVLVLHIFCSTVLKIGNLYIEMDFGRGIIEKRYFLGFSHANSLNLLINITILCWIYTYFSKIKNIKQKSISLILLMIVIVVTYMLTKSRTGIIISFIILLLTFIYGNKKYNFMKNYKLINTGYVLIVITTIVVICFCKDTAIFKGINDLLTGRLQFGNMFIEKYGVNLLGQEMSSMYQTEQGYTLNLAVDQGIINPLIMYGIIINVIFYSLQLLLIRKYCKEKQYKRVMVIILMLIYALTENVLYYPFTNIGILFIADLLYNDNKSRNIPKGKE